MDVEERFRYWGPIHIQMYKIEILSFLHLKVLNYYICKGVLIGHCNVYTTQGSLCGLRCLTPLSTIFQLHNVYRGGQLY